MKKAKWTYRQLTNAMSNEGWENWHQGTWAFKRQDGTFYQVNLYRYDAKDRRVEWHKWAEANETPPPF